MNHLAARCSALALAITLPCLLLGACKDKHEPIKPTVQQTAPDAPARSA